ncbi:MAG: cell division protein ZapA [Rhodospirillaceae bacterium]|nr:cell division protein ZapA [Rhodospirillaceae bacterium]
MGQVSITIRGRQHLIACDDGQEAHLARLGRYVDQRAAQIATSSGSVSDVLLLVMVSLMVADDLADATAELEEFNAAAANPGQARAVRIEAEKEAAAAIDSLAARIERIVVGLEAS